MVSLDKPFSRVTPASWHLHRPASTILVLTTALLFYTLLSYLLQPLVRFFQLMISPESTIMLTMIPSGAMCHGPTSGRSLSVSFLYTVHYLWDTGSFAPFIFIPGRSFFLTVLPVEVARAPGAIRRRSVHKYAVPSNHV